MPDGNVTSRRELAARVLVATFAASLVVFGIGAYLAFQYICQPPGAIVMLLGMIVAAGCGLSCAVFAFARRSLGFGIGAAAVAFELLIKFVLLGSMTAPGCSGI